MIQTIGIQRVLLIVIMAILALGGYFFNTSYLEPELNRKDRQLRAIQAQYSKVSQDTQKISQGVDIFNEQKEEFIIIQKSGFFDDQNRVKARNRLQEIQLESRLKSFRFNISPAETITTEALTESGYKMLSTSIEMDLGAIDDTDINTFLYLLNHGFPGHILLGSVSMKKDQVLTQPLLRNIGLDAQFQPLVTANVQAEWITMVPLEEDASQTQGNN